MAVRSQMARERIVNYIAGNGFISGDKLPPEKTMAEICDVSMITVRRALAELESNNIVERVHGRGTFVKIDLHSTPQLGRILFICIGPVHESKNSSVFATIEEEAAKRGCQTDYFKVGEHPESCVLANLEDCKGIILYGWVNREWVDFISGLGIPAAAVSTDTFDDRIPTVTYDYYDMAKMVTTRLAEQGYRRIGCLISQDSHYPQNGLAGQGYRDALAAHGIPFDPTSHLTEPLRYGHYFEDIGEYFRNLNEPIDALLLYGVGIYINFLNFLLENPQLPPIQIGVILFSNKFQLASANLKRTVGVIKSMPLGVTLLNLLFSREQKHVRIPGVYLADYLQTEGD